MEGYTIIVVIFGVLILFLFIGIYFINRILQYKIKIDNSFAAIKENLDKRVDIVSDMIDFLNANLEYEKSYQKRLIKTKELLLTIKNNKDGVETYKKTEEDIMVFVSLENTYKNLAKNKEYSLIKMAILNNKEKLVYAMDSYDKGVISYNNYRENKFIYLLSKLCRIPEYDCYNK